MTKQSEREAEGINRRTVLQGAAATGVGLAGLSGLSGAAVAGGQGKGASNPCEECGGLLAKYEWEDGEFVFEEGRESLNINGDDFDITVEATNEDGEPLQFDWQSVDPLDNGGLYDASCMTVKTGEDTWTFDHGWKSGGGFNARYYDEEDPVQAISNFALCIRCAFWQIDLGTGRPPVLYTEDPDTRESYGDDTDGVLLAAQTHGRRDKECGDLSQYTVNNGATDDVEITQRIDVADDLSEATAVFEVINPVRVHIGVWEVPGPYEKEEMAWGPRYSLIDSEEELEPGMYEWTVDLPTV